MKVVMCGHGVMLLRERVAHKGNNGLAQGNILWKKTIFAPKALVNVKKSGIIYYVTHIFCIDDCVLKHFLLLIFICRR